MNQGWPEKPFLANSDKQKLGITMPVLRLKRIYPISLARLPGAVYSACRVCWLGCHSFSLRILLQMLESFFGQKESVSIRFLSDVILAEAE